MPKRTTNSPSGKAVTTVMLLAAIGVGVFAAYVKFTPHAARVPDEIRRPAVNAPIAPHVTRPRPSGPEIAVDQAPAVPSDLKIPMVKGGDVVLDKAAGSIPAGQKPVVFLLNATLKEFNLGKARALGYQVKDRNALVDFNEALDKGYGSTEEGQLIKALQLALGQFPEIDTFQVVIGGKAKDSLGQIDLSEPISVIRPDGKEAKPPTTPSEGQDPASPN